jgi:uncharacterized protein DUF6011
MMTTTPRCKICKTPLKNPESIAKGVGPECAQKFAFMLCDAGLTLSSLGISKSIATDSLVALSLCRAEKALLAGNRRDMEHFKATAKRDAERLARAAA